MVHYSPSRLLYGDDIGALARESGLTARLGDRALLIADGEEAEAIDVIRTGLERAGIEALLFPEATEYAPADVASAAATLFRDSKAQFIVAAGPPPTLGLGKAVSLLAADTEGRHTLFGLMDRSEAGIPSVPVVLAPTRMWSPLLFSGLAVVPDPRDRIARAFPSGIADTVLVAGQLPSMLTEKQAVYDLMCILGHSCEAVPNAEPSVDLPLALATVAGAAGEARQIPMDDIALDRTAIQQMGIRAAMAAPYPTFAASVGWAVYAMYEIPVCWAAATAMPTAAEALARSTRVASASGALGTDIPADIGDELRSLAALADIPLRLRDLGLKEADRIKTVSAVAGICGFSSEQVSSLLSDTW